MTAVSVLAGPERRRRWTSAEKLRIVNECETAGLSVAEFARQRDIHPNLIHAWRRQVRTGAPLRTSPGEVRFAPVRIVAGADPTLTTATQA
jgi:transposase